MGNHNALDSAATDGVQKGEETGALEVEARGDVREADVSIGLSDAERGELAVEVGALVVRGDASIEDDSSRGRFFVTKNALNVCCPVEPPAAARGADALDFALVGPALESCL